VSCLLRSFRHLLPAVATLAAFAFLSVASLHAQPAEKSSAENPSRAEKQDDPSANPPEKKSPAKRPVEKPAVEKKSDGAKPDEKKPDENRPTPKKAEDRKSDREVVAKAFAEEHHPELASLLRTLEKMHPQAYQAAVRDVARAADRLNALKERDDERYARELEVWKTRSRVHVVSAEYRVSPGAALESSLRQLMQDELQAKRELLAFDRERAEKRLEQLDRELRELDEKGSAMIDRQIERLPKVPASVLKTKPKN
jgi:hypothetical protein